MDIENLICDFEGVNISNDKPRFLLNNKIKVEEIKFYFVTDVTLDFYQVWSMFHKVPIVNKNGKWKYEFRFTTTKKSDVVFLLCSKDRDFNFINTKHWRILCNKKNDEISDSFLSTLCEALECYKIYYKDYIESHNFTNDDPMINECLQQIKYSIIKNKDILKNI